MKIAVVLGKFAPFHYSRLEAAQRLAATRGDAIVGIEVAERQRDYTWPDVTGKTYAFEKIVLVQGREYWSVRGQELATRLFQVLDDARPDVIVLAGYAFAECRLGLRWAIRSDVPRVVMSDSHSVGREPETRWRRTAKKLVLGLFDAAMVGGTRQRRYLETYGFDARKVFPGSAVIDNELFHPREDGRRAFRDRIHVFSALRLIPEKNILFVLEAMRTDGMDWRWTIAGDGPLEREVTESVERLGLRNRVSLIGHVNYLDLPRYYSSADYYLQPSISEQWGLAVNEAMASSLPLLVSDRCGCIEDLLLPAVNGFSFDPTSTSSFLDGIRKMHSSRERWGDMGSASRRIIDGWGPERFAESLLAATDAAVGTKRHGRTAAELIGLVM